MLFKKSGIAALCFMAPCFTLKAFAAEGEYVFSAAPTIEVNRVYRVNRYTGEMAACQYGLQEGSVGTTLCYPAGDGGGAQNTPGEYGLISSNHLKESGIFRVNKRTGEMSICYVLSNTVVCTPSTR